MRRYFSALFLVLALGGVARAIQAIDLSPSNTGINGRGPAAFSTFPACAAAYEGYSVAVNDSTTNTWGATVTGGSSNHIKMYCDGTNWTVEAK